MRLSKKIEIQPTSTQVQSLRQHCGNARWAYNWGLQKRIEAHKEWVGLGKPKGFAWPSAVSLHRDLVVLKKAPVDEGGVPWMYEASKCAPQEALRNLDKAFQGFFRNLKAGKLKGYPKFKRRNDNKASFSLGGTIRAGEKFIQLPILGRIRIKPGQHGYLPIEQFSTATVSMKAGRWFVSVVPKQDIVEQPVDSTQPKVGVDWGVAKLATLSTGEYFENPKPLRQKAKKIKTLQKKLSRQKKGSGHYSKTKKSLCSVFSQVANVRKDALHKLTYYLTKSHSQVVIEDLKPRNMVRSCKGKGKAAKAGLNKSVLDAAFGEFRRQLEYKGKLYGCTITAVHPAYTSQRCSVCSHVEKGNRKSQSSFRCLGCGHSENADLNAAKNILVAGSCPDTLNARGGIVRLDRACPGQQISVKRESAGEAEWSVSYRLEQRLVI